MKIFVLFKVLMVILAIGIWEFDHVLGKECTNVPTPLSSHTFRYELLKSKNESWRTEIYSHYHVTPTEESAWADLLPRKMLREEDELNWVMMYRSVKNSYGSKLGGNFLKEVSLHDVRLDPESYHWRGQQTNLEYLLILDVDRLLWSFRKTAGLATPGMAYGGWEGSDVELRGHFVGHYLSATAHMWASTHNDTVHEKMNAVVSGLSACQEKIGSGYLSAFPSELFDRFEAIRPVWAPYYTIHKIMAGLLDQYTLAGNTQALKMLTWMVDYFYKRVQNVIVRHSVERHWQSLNEEVGGMNDLLYRLYVVTQDPNHLVLAHLFDKPCFLGLLAVQADDISGFHSNTHIPIVVGAQMRYEVTGDPLYKAIGTFFMEVVNSSHAYATGGTSSGEFWSDPKRLAETLGTETEESCTTYNMLKVARNLFRWTKEAAYADYYERALTNGVLSIQRGQEPGVMIYMLPLGHGNSKAHSYHGWGTKFNSFWCCYGTGIESFSKLGDSIYFEEEGSVLGLYIIQYISSSLDWKSGKVTVNQKVDPVVSWDPYLRVTITVSSKEGSSQSASLNFRVPVWTESSGAKALLNSGNLLLPAPGNFLSVTRNWSPGDKLTLQFPITLRKEAIKDDQAKYESIHAILYGPYLLAGLTNGDWDIKTKSKASLSDWITPIPSDYNSQLISLSQETESSTFLFTNSNQTLKMERTLEPGTNSATHATFRLILQDSASSSFSSRQEVIGKSAALEPFDRLGMIVSHQGPNENLVVSNPSESNGLFTFRIVEGLDGNAITVSLESIHDEGCYVYSGVNYDSGTSITLGCKSKSSNPEFNKAASFALNSGISKYHPLSFVANGVRRSYVLMPLLSLRDESYTTYFDIELT